MPVELNLNNSGGRNKRGADIKYVYVLYKGTYNYNSGQYPKVVFFRVNN